jgi:hypothetical protein
LLAGVARVDLENLGKKMKTEVVIEKSIWDDIFMYTLPTSKEYGSTN